MPLLVTSAAGANGNGYGALLAFDVEGRPLGAFSTDSRIADPRRLAVDRVAGLLLLNSGGDRVLALDRNGRVVRDSGRIDGPNPGGGNFGPDGRYYVGLRSTRTITAFPAAFDTAGEFILPPNIVPFPRGFAFGGDGRLFLASGIGPNGEGDDTILAFAPGGRMRPSVLVSDPELSPLDLAIAALGLPLEKVSVRLGDTRLPDSHASIGSATMANAGASVLLAANAARDKAIALALSGRDAPFAGAAADAVVVADGRLAVAGTNRNLTYAELLERNGLSTLAADAAYDPLPEADGPKGGLQLCRGVRRSSR